MRPLGDFSHVTRSGNIVLKGGKDTRVLPALYAPVVVEGEVIGKVSDIIGPVSGPYIIIRPKKGVDPGSMKGLKTAMFFESERVYRVCKKDNRKGKKKRYYRGRRGKGMKRKV